MDVLIGVLLLNLGAIPIYKKFKIKGSGAYFACFSVTLMLIWAGALVDLLLPVSILCIAAILGVNIYFLLRHGCKAWFADARKYFSLPVWLCNITSALFALIYTIQKPFFYYWDEYSFWGISARVVKEANRLYSIGESSLHDMRHLPSGNAILSYFFQLFSHEFADYKLLLSYCFLFFAVFALAAEVVIHYNKSVRQGIVIYFAMLLTPFLSVFHLPDADYSTLSYAYATSMSDFTIPVVFIGVVLMYLIKPKSLWFLAPLGYLVTVKNTSIFFAFLAGLVICSFILLNKADNRLQIIKRLLICCVIIFIPVLVFFSWSQHIKHYTVPPIEGKYDLSAKLDVPPSTRLATAPVPHEERFVEVLQSMKQDFNNEKITTLAPDKILVVLLFIIGVASVFLANKGNRLSIALITTGLAVGCLVYCITISYFIADFGDGMVEYPRYMTSYYFAWIYLSFTLLVLCLNGKELVAQAVILGATLLGASALYNTNVEYTAIGAPQNAYEISLKLTKELAQAKTVIKNGDRVFLVMLDQDTVTFFYYRYNLMPAIVSVDTKNTGIDFSINFRTNVKSTDKRTYYNVASPQVFTDVMRDYFDYIYVVTPDVEFHDGYSDLFSDGMQNNKLYKVTDSDKKPMQAVTYEN